ncbi:sulfite exporter TauE/SafE family protein [Listeria monocytogenes]|nr:sulfite exporter TauE/SafE family protein [Listeria monocytogenes]
MATILLVVLGALTIYFLSYFIKDIYRNRNNLGKGNYVVSMIIGFITDFLDTLGIGCFAPTTLAFKLTKYLKSDALLPGTLNIAHSIPVILEAFIFIRVVEVSPVTLISLVIAAIIGSFVGSRTVVKLPEKKVQMIMGIALIITAVLMILKQQGLLDALGKDNTALGLSGIRLVIGIVGNFIFGALMSAGVGLYAPCMAMVALLGLNPLVAFPIMMGSCAGLMPVASVEYIKVGEYSRKAAIGITLGGIVGVVIAATLVKSMNLEILMWVIIVVIIYTGISMLIQSLKGKEEVMEV